MEPRESPRDEELETLYSIGYHLMSNGKYDEAVDFFGVLISLKPEAARYWCGLGAATHARGNVLGAAMAYEAAAALDPDDSLTTLNRAEAWIELGDRERARALLTPLANQARGAVKLRAQGLVRRCGAKS